MFDKKEFAKLLIEAKGDRSMRSYATLSDVSAAHLSRLSRGLISAPPSPETLKKLSVHAENGISLKAFMHSCGYYEEPELVRGDRHNEVTRLLFETQDTWSVRKGKYADYELLDKEGNRWEWVEGGMPGEVYGRLAMMPVSKNKRSIVVRGKSESDKFLKNPPSSLMGEYTLILLNENEWKEIPFK